MGKNRKKRSALQTLIDLTPLLDVIFLVLIVSLMEQSSLAAKMKDTEAQNYDVINNTILTDLKETYEDINEYVDCVTLYAGYQSETDRTVRNVYVQINTEDLVTFELKKGDEANVWKTVASYIEGNCLSDPDKHVILSIADNRNEYMLYRDEKSIEDMLFELSGKYSYVSIKQKSENAAE